MHAWAPSAVRLAKMVTLEEVLILKEQTRTGEAEQTSRERWRGLMQRGMQGFGVKHVVTQTDVRPGHLTS